MIKLIRVDGRLIHGQVASSILNQSGFDRCLVIDDASANDPILAKTLLMGAANSSIKVAVKTVENAMKILADPRAKNLSILVVTGSLDTVEKIVNEHKDDVKAINIGNYGMVNKSEKPRKDYFKYCFLNEDEYAQLKRIVDTGIETYYQDVPTRPSYDIRTIYK